MRYLGYNIICFCCLFACFTSCRQTDNSFPQVRQIVSFNDSWSFTLGDDSLYSVPEFDASGWRILDLPHDWSIEGEFSENNPATAGCGALPGGIGWYRKSFVTDSLWLDKTVAIEFDGVYMNSDVWINGHHLGNRPNGYINFRYDLTPYLNVRGQENTIAVRVNNSEQPNSRWYSGSGIYRKVILVAENKMHIAYNGVYVYTPVVNKNNAEVCVETIINNESGEPQKCKIAVSLVNLDGKIEAMNISEIILSDSSHNDTIRQQMNIRSPKLWSVDSPNLYTLQVQIMQGNQIIDNYSQRCGIRYFEFTNQDGFRLNGQLLKIKGVCMHHDLGVLGAAFNRRAAKRQLEILKQMGCNGIRTSHNPPAAEYLDLCDEMGFIVMDETFDMWYKRKSPFDYSRYFAQWHEKDLRDQILRDRNHPSIFMWCIGNEVLEQWDHASNDELDLAAANMLINFQSEEQKKSSKKDGVNLSALLTARLAGIVKDLDKTRPIIAGCNEPGASNNLFLSEALDIIGINYHESDWSSCINRYSGKPFLATETTSGLMTRGFYEMPSDKNIIRPVDWRTAFSTPHMKCSAYDNCHVPWGSSHEDCWSMAKNNNSVSGIYVWTGFDYLGEPTPYSWPARSSYFGIVDMAGIPKDIYYFYQSEWSSDTVLHLFPHWNWKEGEDVDLWVYYNNADQVELFVNDKSQGIKQKEDGKFHVQWRVPFQKGTIKVVSRKNGETVKEQSLNTATEAYTIRLTPDRTEINADGEDLCFITVEVIDQDGNLVPDAEHLLTFSAEGPAKIEGADNGCQTGHESLRDNKENAFFGKCVVIIRSTKDKGPVKISCQGDGLKDAAVNITTL